MNTSLETLPDSIRWIAAGLEESGWAAEVCDAEWRLVWMSSQGLAMLGNPRPETIGVGQSILESRLLPVWEGVVEEQSRKDWLYQNVPQMLADLSVEDLVAQAPFIEPYLDGVQPATVPVCTGLSAFRRSDGSPLQIRYFGARLRDLDGTGLATVYLYGSPLPATLLALVSSGSRAMFERMARLADPGRREAAILFADLQASGALSRRLSSAAYFELIRSLTTAMDEVIIDRKGIVGAHAGDGVSAFFLADDVGSASAAALAGLDAARGLAAVARETAATIDQVTPTDVRLNIGVHWGGTLYMGQVVTGGRLEVTALGDEVNEAARLQQAASDGQVLVSKSLVERLSIGDAATLGIDPDRMSYKAVAELPTVDEKIVRDAGSIAVAALPA